MPEIKPDNKPVKSSSPAKTSFFDFFKKEKPKIQVSFGSSK
jgi:hypothetical protein